MSDAVALERSRRTEPPTSRKPRLLLINPRIKPNYWTLTETVSITGASALMPNLALMTLAAMIPEDQFDYELVDENAGGEPGGFYDVVAITGYTTQWSEMKRIAETYRAAGSLVVIGGPFATLSAHLVRGHADVLFLGEAEETWPSFLADYRAGRVSETYRAGDVDITASPVPRTDLTDFGLYSSGVVQTSRGCPFSCEYCDVIVYLGRRQRHKRPAQVIDELEAQYRGGARAIFLADDNFTSKPAAAREIVEAIRRWNCSKEVPVALYTQLSVDIALPRNRDLLQACVQAGITVGFIGLETDSIEALTSVDKLQNTRQDVYESIRVVHAAGMQIHAGLMLGFDTETTTDFAARYRFVQSSAVPIFSVTVLNAPYGTPLYTSMARQGRIADDGEVDLFFRTNMEPLQMSREELTAGAVWLVNRIYHPEAFIDRVKAFAEQIPDAVTLPGPSGHGQSPGDLWARYRSSFDSFGLPVDVPRAALRAMRGKDARHLFLILLYYRNILGILRHWGILEPALYEQWAFEGAFELISAKGLVRE